MRTQTEQARHWEAAYIQRVRLLPAVDPARWQPEDGRYPVERGPGHAGLPVLRLRRRRTLIGRLWAAWWVWQRAEREGAVVVEVMG